MGVDPDTSPAFPDYLGISIEIRAEHFIRAIRRAVLVLTPVGWLT